MRPLRIAAVAASLVAVAAAGTFAWIAAGPDATAFAGGTRVALAAYDGPTPTGAPSEIRGADLLTRGAYLTRAADCQACHSVEGGKPFAGGRAFKLPFGTIYAPNITPDAETGIGRWSDAQFLRAVHEGIGRDGERLYPAFPYAAYTLLADDDVMAIKAYLFSLKPVRNVVPTTSLAFPFNQRPLMGAWSLLFNSNRRFEPVRERSAAWNRGAYVVEAAGHCGECHTPRNLMQALDNRSKFAGAVVAGWRAYDITPDAATGIGAWSDDELAHYLSEGHAAGHGGAAGPMGEAVDMSLTHLSASDVAAVVTYLRTVPALQAEDLPNTLAPPPTRSASADATVDPIGQRIFEGACASCHDWNGKGAMRQAAGLTGDRAVNDPTALNVVQIVLGGHAGSKADGHTYMPAFKAGYSDAEIAAVANYVTRRFGTTASAVQPTDVGAARLIQ